MVEAARRGVFLVLGCSVNGGFMWQQCAPHHPSPHRKFPDFLSRLDHGAIQPPDNGPPEHIYSAFIPTDRTTPQEEAALVRL